MEFKDYYRTLGIARDAKPDAIKRAYQRLARKYHPDVNREPDAEERFKDVAEAYEVLKDPERRAAYDQFGADWEAGQNFRPPPDWEAGAGFARRGHAAAGGFSDFFESLFGAAAPGRPRTGPAGVVMTGEDIHARVEVSLEDSYRGATRSLALKLPELDREGRLVTRRRRLNVRIPKGIVQGQQIRLRGQGGAGLGGAPAGDLYLDVVFAPHPWLEPVGRDVYLDLPVAPWEAALGESVTVPTLGGKVDLAIPAGAQTGTRLRLKGRGLPGTPPGDQYAVLEVRTPAADTREARAIYERMKHELAFDPRAHLVEA